MSEMRLDPKIVGEVIAKYRMKKGLTQEVLSGLSDIGRTHLSAIERGERKPNPGDALPNQSGRWTSKMSDYSLWKSKKN